MFFARFLNNKTNSGTRQSVYKVYFEKYLNYLWMFVKFSFRCESKISIKCFVLDRSSIFFQASKGRKNKTELERQVLEIQPGRNE